MMGFPLKIVVFHYLCAKSPTFGAPLINTPSDSPEEPPVAGESGRNRGPEPPQRPEKRFWPTVPGQRLTSYQAADTIAYDNLNPP